MSSRHSTTAISAPDPAKVIEALAPSSPEYLAMRRAYANYLALAASGGRGSGIGVIVMALK